MTKYWTATYIGLTPMTFLWGVTQVTDYLTRMHTAHLANVSKSVTKNATFPRTGGLPCLITHSCMSAASSTVVGGLIFCISATPHPGSLFPLFHVFTRSHPGKQTNVVSRISKVSSPHLLLFLDPYLNILFVLLFMQSTVSLQST